MTEQRVRERIRARIGEMASVPAGELTSETTLTGDLPLDSLQLYELAAALEDEFGLPEIDEDDVAGIETIGDVERRVLELLPDRAGADAQPPGLRADRLAG
jgi:acyl carrier protein